MTTIDTAAAIPDAPVGRGMHRSTLTVGLIATTLLLLAALHVIDAGYIRDDVLALQGGNAWRNGGWLSQVVLRFLDLLRDTAVQQTVLSLVAAGICGTLFAVVYDRLRANGWFVLGAVTVLVALGMHAGVLYTLTASSRALPVIVAIAALVPAIRMMEDSGDVQSAMGLGLLLPLLLLASPITTPLILPFALGAALAGTDSRKDPRAFIAMLLVAILPTLIVVLGIVGFLLQAQIDPALIFAPYTSTFGRFQLVDPTAGLTVLAAFAPVLLVPIAYCFWPRLPERRHVLSALAVVALPLYLVVARVSLPSEISPMAPVVALLAAFVSWLTVVRLPFTLRMLALVLLATSAALTWMMPELWNDPAWKAALLSLPNNPFTAGYEFFLPISDGSNGVVW